MKSAPNNGLPSRVDVEKLVLGAAMVDAEYSNAVAGLTSDLFTLEKHRLILRAIKVLHGRGEQPERVTVVNELMNRNELEKCDGMGYIVTLDDGLPRLANFDGYLRILADQASLRRILYSCQNLVSRVRGGEAAAEIAAVAQELFSGVAHSTRTYRVIEDLQTLEESMVCNIEPINEPLLYRGGISLFTGEPSSGKSTILCAAARDAVRTKGIPVLLLDRENPAAVIRDRLARLGMSDGENFRVWHGGLDQEPPQPDSPIVLDFVRRQKALVLIDGLSAFHRGDENSAGETRVLMDQCRRITNLGGSVGLLHHSGKSETSREFRGSSDIKAAVDVAFHVSNYSSDARLGKLVLRVFKHRYGFYGSLSYRYDDGRLLREQEPEDLRESSNHALSGILKTNPGINVTRFEELALGKNVSRERAREFLRDGVLTGSIRMQSGTKNSKRIYLCLPNDSANSTPMEGERR